MKRALLPIALWIGLTAVLFAFGGCKDKSKEQREERLGRLSLHMQQLYKRELHKDRFSINYVPRPPDTIMIMIQEYPDANKSLVLSLIASAKEIVHNISHQFELDSVNVEYQITEIEPPPSEAQEPAPSQ